MSPELKQLIKNHLHYTCSDRAMMLLQDWEKALNQFRKIISQEYKQMLGNRD